MPSVRRLTAILAADVAGYSRLMGADEEGTHERLRAHLRELIEPKIGEHRGRVVKNTGDGFLAEFASVVDAVRCAVEMQRGMAEREPEVPEEQRIRFRIGINVGDVIVEEHDIFGDGVNVAARLEALAEPGGVCISGTVRDHIGDRLPYALENLGEQRVKNIARPVRAYALRPQGVTNLPRLRGPALPIWHSRAVIGIVAAAMLVIVCVAGWLWQAATARSGAGTPPAQAAASASLMPTAPVGTSIPQPLVAPRLSIVVLPFTNLSNEPDQQYFVDGVTEDVTTDLSRIPDMFVISRNTAFTYRNKPVDAKQIGRELGVRYVLEGSVRRSGHRLRVNTQLIDAETDAHLWAERFDRDADEVLVLQNEITSRIANALGTVLVGAEAARPIDHPDALDYILRGSAAMSKPPSRDSVAEAIRLFESALTLTSHSVEAQTRLAGVLVERVLDGLSDSRAADLERAEALIDQALAASPRSPYVHFVKGALLRAQNRWEDAIPEYETALAVNRNFVGALNGLAWCKLAAGSIEQVIPLVEQAIRLSPRDPGIGFRYYQIGTVHLLQSRTNEAMVWFEKARAALPGVPHVHGRLASVYALRGETERAVAELAEAQRLNGGDLFSSISHLRAGGFWGSPETRSLFETTYFAGLRKAGMPEE
jgi:adenylate cyclase